MQKTNDKFPLLTKKITDEVFKNLVENTVTESQKNKALKKV